MVNSGWARLLYDACGCMEKLTFIREIWPASTVQALPQPHKPACLASERRHAHDRRRREVWAERRINHSPSPIPTPHLQRKITLPRPHRLLLVLPHLQALLLHCPQFSQPHHHNGLDCHQLLHRSKPQHQGNKQKPSVRCPAPVAKLQYLPKKANPAAWQLFFTSLALKAVTLEPACYSVHL